MSALTTLVASVAVAAHGVAYAGNEAQFAAVGPRSAQPLRIVGSRSVRVETLLLDHTQQVSIGPLAIAPRTQDASVQVVGSAHVYLGSLRMSWRYGGLPRRDRPFLVNNVIGFLERPWPVCKSVRAAVSNVVVHGTTCSASDVNGPVDLDSRGRPTAASALVIDAGSRRYAPPTDITGRRRGSDPDIGAFEYLGR